MAPRDLDPLLQRAAAMAGEYLDGLAERHVGAREDAVTVAERLRVALPDAGEDPLQVIERMARDVDPGIVASSGPRYFGFVIGGAVPASVAADWLTTAWDQNTATHALSPAAAAAEQVAGAGCWSCSGSRRRRASASRPARGSGTRSAWRPRATRSSTGSAGTWRRAACTARREIEVVIGDEATPPS